MNDSRYVIGSRLVPKDLPLYKKMYCVKNFWKSGMLLLILLKATGPILNGFLNDDWDNPTIW